MFLTARGASFFLTNTSDGVEKRSTGVEDVSWMTEWPSVRLSLACPPSYLAQKLGEDGYTKAQANNFPLSRRMTFASRTEPLIGKAPVLVSGTGSKEEWRLLSSTHHLCFSHTPSSRHRWTGSISLGDGALPNISASQSTCACTPPLVQAGSRLRLVIFHFQGLDFTTTGSARLLRL